MHKAASVLFLTTVTQTHTQAGFDLSVCLTSCDMSFSLKPHTLIFGAFELIYVERD